MNRREWTKLTALGACALAGKSLLSAAPPDKPAFAHPGILHNREELDFIKARITAGAEPWKSEFATLQASRLAALNYSPEPRAEVIRGPYNNPNIGSTEFSTDAAAAYSHALLWTLTGKEAHARKSAEIINAWSTTLTTVSGHDTKLLIGMMGVRFCAAAELLRHTWKGWPAADQKKFETLLRKILHPPIAGFFPTANGNWDASMIQTIMAMGIFLDDRPMFQSAVDYFLTGEGNGSVEHYFKKSGQCQESGRDQAHTQMGLGFLGCAAEIAWKQGVDLYSAADNRLAAGFEYTAKYNLGNDVPYERFRSIDGKYDYRKISDDSRGRFSPIYHRAAYHYHHRKKLDMPFTRQAAAKGPPRRERSSSHMPWEALMFATPPPVAD